MKILGNIATLQYTSDIKFFLREMLSVQARNTYQKLPLKTRNPNICNSCWRLKINQKYK